MKIEVICRSQERKEFIEACAKFYAKALNITNSRFSLTIRSLYNLRERKGSRGEVFQSEPRGIYMVLDSRLTMSQLLMTLAHEMVHVKQIARGQYKGKRARNGRLMACWMGAVVSTEYMKRPWEIEAFARQGELVEQLVEFVSKNAT